MLNCLSESSYELNTVFNIQSAYFVCMLYKSHTPIPLSRTDSLLAFFLILKVILARSLEEFLGSGYYILMQQHYRDYVRYYAECK